jgi:Ca2+-binding RTX toxin-like protein
MTRIHQRSRLAAGIALTAATASRSVGLLAGPSAGSAAPTCRGLTATIVGNARANDIDGTAGRDVIVGRGGNDDIEGKGGNDVICGNRGADELEGDRGNDRLYGGIGHDEAEEVEGC